MNRFHHRDALDPTKFLAFFWVYLAALFLISLWS